jgi:hypothetical protein
MTMPFLMHISFDNSGLLGRNVYYFEYRGIRFKLIQSTSLRWCSVLLTILPEDTATSRNQAYMAASEFLSALAWQNHSTVAMWDSRGLGVPKHLRLRQAKRFVFDLPRIAIRHKGRVVGLDICTLPKVETDEQRTALVLFREARSSNNCYLSFLFFWQVMETAGANIVEWVNSAYEKHRDALTITDYELKRLPLKGGKLGNYLEDDCRHAIAHIRRYSWKTSLKLDTAVDNERIAVSSNIVERFAAFYIREELGLRKRQYLIRKGGKGFPVFVDEEYLSTHSCTIAYRRVDSWKL